MPGPQEEQGGRAAVRQMGVEQHQGRDDDEPDDAGEPDDRGTVPGGMTSARPRRTPRQTNHPNTKRNGSPPLNRSHIATLDPGVAGRRARHRGPGGGPDPDKKALPLDRSGQKYVVRSRSGRTS